MDYINSDEYKAYVDLKNKTIKHLENARKTWEKLNSERGIKINK
jgi:hypothetical protein